MENFTPIPALIGGLLLGVSATLLLLLNGRIAGISGVANGLLYGEQNDRAWRAWFLAGLIGASGLYYHLTPHVFSLRAGFPLWALLAAGFLVGFGTRMGAGCTSGHGICGLGRLSLRSLAATMTFMVFGVLIAIVSRHVLGIGS
jgi:uncharacterized membrane protein YedE/YeeE